MDLQELKLNIKDNQLSNFYVFTGEEYGIMREYVNRIAIMKKIDVRVIDSLIEVKSNLLNKSLIPSYYLYYAINDKEFYNDKQIMEFLQKCNYNGVIIIRSKIDNRLQWTKTFSDKIVYFNSLTFEVLGGYIYRKLKCNERQARWIVETCEYDYSRIMSEVDKLVALKNEKLKIGKISDEHLTEYAIQSGLIARSYPDIVFHFIECIMGATDNVFEIAEECIKSGEPPLIILRNLYLNVKNLLMYKGYSGKVPNGVLNYYQIQNCRKWEKIWTARQLTFLLNIVEEVETKLKNGDIDNQFAVDYILIQLFGGV